MICLNPGRTVLSLWVLYVVGEHISANLHEKPLGSAVSWFVTTTFIVLHLGFYVTDHHKVSHICGTEAK